MRLFLDANVLFSAALSPEGVASSLFAFADAGACELVTSAFVVAEVTRNLRVKAPAGVGIVVEADARLVERIDVPLPAKDRPILAAAVGCRANVLVTGDRRHFGPLFGRRFGGTVVLSPREALEFLVEASGDPRSGSDVR